MPDSQNEALIHQLLAERAQLQARVAELTVELECASQYAPPGAWPSAVHAVTVTPAQTRGLAWG